MKMNWMIILFLMLFIKELMNMIVKETNRYIEQFPHGCELAVRSPARAWKPVTGGEIYVVLGLFMLTGLGTLGGVFL
jgi:hypothetical protein